jgi:divalent metal cation (Fe/Co/Zn/Cd) transporter
MFTTIAFFAVALLALFADRQHRHDSDAVEANAKHARQELRMIVYLLAAILLALGVIADRLH